MFVWKIFRRDRRVLSHDQVAESKRNRLLHGCVASSSSLPQPPLNTPPTPQHAYRLSHSSRAGVQHVARAEFRRQRGPVGGRSNHGKHGGVERRLPGEQGDSHFSRLRDAAWRLGGRQYRVLASIASAATM